MKILEHLFSRLVIVGLIILIQAGWFILFLIRLGRYSTGIHIVFVAISLLAVLYIVNEEENPAVKLAWVIPILLVPLLGGLLYLMFGTKATGARLRDRLEQEYARSAPFIKQEEAVFQSLCERDIRAANQCRYLINWGFPVYRNTSADYYKCGEEMFAAMKEELQKAEHFIFMEYFIIDKGRMWDEILSILREKVKEGVEVRLIYDDVGCLDLLPIKYHETLEKEGIHCLAFNRFVPFVSIVMNNRDHRKIMVIDGHTGFTGGINLADEYINEIHRLGYWKDTGVRLNGEGVWNLTVMFLQMWNAMRMTTEDYSPYRPECHINGKFEHEDGFIQPYGDMPLDRETVGENVYLNLINQSGRYVYIFTPYLIVDNEMITALTLAAKRGVDIRIVTPGIPDKKPIFWLTQSYYSQLLRHGVRIYEYTPGFIHAKCFVCDDEIATVGTINLDYRSLYLHFECGVFIYRSKAVYSLKQDACNTFAVSREITADQVQKRFPVQLAQAVLRCLAPLF